MSDRHAPRRNQLTVWARGFGGGYGIFNHSNALALAEGFNHVAGFGCGAVCNSAFVP